MPDLCPVPQIEKNNTDISTILSKTKSSRLAECLVNAQTLLEHGEVDMARPLIFEALKIDSNNLLALSKALSILDSKREIKQKIQIQSAICQIRPSFENLSLLGEFLYAAQRDDDSLKIYLQALNLVTTQTSGLFNAYKNIGNILTKAGDYDGAEEYFHKAFAIDPQSDVLLVNLGTLAVQRSDFAMAIEHFRAALKENNRNDKASGRISFIASASR